MVARHLAIWIIGASLLLAAGCGGPSAASPIGGQTPPVDQVAPAAANLGHAETAASGTDSLKIFEVAATAAAAAEPSTPPQLQRPPADRTITKPGDAEKITWDDLNLGMQADVVFRPFMADPVKDLAGKRISIVGYMHGGQAGQRGIKEFILLKNTQCKFGPGGQADHLADVKLKPDSSVLYTPSPIKVEGTLVLEPFQGPDGNTWSIYRLEAAQIRN
jgi:hypothetical protein